MEQEKKTLLCSLREGVQVQVHLPVDFNKADAERLKKYIDLEAEISMAVPAKQRRRRGPNKEREKTPPHSVLKEIQDKGSSKN